MAKLLIDPVTRAARLVFAPPPGVIIRPPRPLAPAPASCCLGGKGKPSGKK